MKDEKKVQVQVEDQIADGVYSNMVVINFTETEFTLDFIHIQPQNKRAKVRSRVILTPQNAKRLYNALGASINGYETNFGNIILKQPNKQNLGPIN